MQTRSDQQRSGEDAEVVETADGSLTLFSRAYGQTYRSTRGALSEARAVFLEASGVAEALAAGRECRVLEVGFGTGLNFLVTAQAAAEAEHGAALRYVALERALPAAGLLARLDYPGLLAPSPLPTELLSWLGELKPRRSELARHEFSPRSAPSVTLELVLGEATTQDLATTGARGYDAVYLDAFSPRANPEAWRPEFLGRLAACLAPGGRLVSFTVSGEVRRALAAHGLAVSKVAGPPGGKAEVLVAQRPLPGDAP